jgi:hypothetical protein
MMTSQLYRELEQLPHSEGGKYMIYGESLILTETALLELEFWYQSVEAWNGYAMRPRTVSFVLYTDASGAGYGGLARRVPERRVEPALVMVTAGKWEPGAVTHSVHTEIRALWMALVAGGGHFWGKTVLHRTDNMCTYDVVSRGKRGLRG